MNKKGFTLVELLGALVILVIISSVAVISYRVVMANSKERVYKTYEQTMYSETVTLLSTHPELMPANGSSKKYTLSYMLSNGYIEQIHNPDNTDDICTSDNESEDSYILVTRNDHYDEISGTYVNDLRYDVYLNCNLSNYSDHETYPR